MGRLFETIALLENGNLSQPLKLVFMVGPVADGPVIELAGQRSLAKDVTLTAIIKKLQNKNSGTFGYRDLTSTQFISLWYQAFVKDLAGHLSRGSLFLICTEPNTLTLSPYLKDSDIALVPLVSLTTGIDRQTVD